MISDDILQWLRHQIRVADRKREFLLFVHAKKAVGISRKKMNHRLVFGRRHPFKNDLKVVDLGNADTEIVSKPIADLGLAHAARPAYQQHLP